MQALGRSIRVGWLKRGLAVALAGTGLTAFPACVPEPDDNSDQIAALAAAAAAAAAAPAAQSAAPAEVTLVQPNTDSLAILAVDGFGNPTAIGRTLAFAPTRSGQQITVTVEADVSTARPIVAVEDSNGQVYLPQGSLVSNRVSISFEAQSTGQHLITALEQVNFNAKYTIKVVGK